MGKLGHSPRKDLCSIGQWERILAYRAPVTPQKVDRCRNGSHITSQTFGPHSQRATRNKNDCGELLGPSTSRWTSSSTRHYAHAFFAESVTRPAAHNTQPAASVTRCS